MKENRLAAIRRSLKDRKKKQNEKKNKSEVLILKENSLIVVGEELPILGKSIWPN